MHMVLGSGGIAPGEKFDAWQREVDQLLAGIQEILFIPYASMNPDQAMQILYERDLALDEN